MSKAIVNAVSIEVDWAAPGTQIEDTLTKGLSATFLTDQHNGWPTYRVQGPAVELITWLGTEYDTDQMVLIQDMLPNLKPVFTPID